MMMARAYVDRIVNAFPSDGSAVKIQMLRSRDGRSSFKAWLRKDGIEVSNLGEQSLLPWQAFDVAIDLMLTNGGHARKGAIQGAKLGDSKLPLDSIEGAVAHRVFGLKIGNTGTRRVTPIAGILRWAGLCDDRRGELFLK